MSARPIRRVLVPVDFSEESRSALRVGAAVAAAHGADLTVLHAELLEAPPYFTHAQVDALERERRTAREAAEEYVRAFARAVTTQPFTPLVVDGTPSDSILRVAGEYDLVVMGTHGRRGAARWRIGSVAEQVVRSSSVPVLVVPRPAQASA